jgi:hypothetical protein
MADKLTALLIWLLCSFFSLDFEDEEDDPPFKLSSSQFFLLTTAEECAD